MKIGDIVQLVGEFSDAGIAIIISSSKFSPGWHMVLYGDETIQWPESQMNLIKE
jgi:hypothetical protein